MPAMLNFGAIAPVTAFVLASLELLWLIRCVRRYGQRGSILHHAPLPVLIEARFRLLSMLVLFELGTIFSLP
jgi:hypothetical protein